MTSNHDSLILEQFTRQAAPFAALPAHSDEYGLDLCLSLAKLDHDDIVLDVACGPGLLACAMAKTAKNVTGIDFTPAMIEQAKRRQDLMGLDTLRWQIGDARSLPFNDSRFTLVTSRYAFHHLENPSLVLAEMKRVCAPGGRIMIIDATPDADKKSAYNAVEMLRDPSHVNALTPDELKSVATSLGLTERASKFYRLEVKLEDLLSASAVPSENIEQIWALFQKDADTGIDLLGMTAHWKYKDLYLCYPISILVVTRNLCETVEP